MKEARLTRKILNLVFAFLDRYYQASIYSEISELERKIILKEFIYG